MTGATSRNVYKTVSVPVEITHADVARSLPAEALRDACRLRGIKLLEPKPPGRKYKIASEDMRGIIDLYQRGDMLGALIALERVLPFPLQHLSVDIERHYRRTLCP